ncbi:hypothetical protein [Actinomyces sp.]|uniref:hypothetical protein n=1 Tax=Actinomyces sp. TaxID=29317 RepID=UPI0026DCFFBC|nr:hypothetical protein [Actinomyces sp.]MDO4899505.1 hypothetical protein [Actinomyces sp.]
MSENTDVNQPDSGSADGGSRRSRRAMREAERAAEREAILTGQQPLLTRREMRRLREEAEALQRALEAGEITAEQARALQDPLADQPVIDAPAPEATGHHAAETPSSGVSTEQTTAAPPATVASPAEPAADSPVSAPADEAPAEPAADSPDSAPADEVPAEPAAAPVPIGTGASSPGTAPEFASSQAAGTGLTDAQKEEISSLPTGVLEAVDAPIVDSTPVAPSSAPRRRSLRDRLAADEEVQSPAEGAVGQRSGLSHVETASAHTDPTASGETYMDETSTLEAAVSAHSPQEPEQAASTPPARRPIVRIPAAAQGVRTVDIDTGELSSVQPVIQPDATLQVSQAQSVADEVEESDTVDAEAEDAVERTDTAAEATEATEADAEVYDGIDNPQWRALTGADSAETDTAGQADQDSAGRAVAGSLSSYRDAAGSEPAQTVPASKGGSRVGRTLLIILLAVVLALVVLAVVWFLMKNGIIGSLPQAFDNWTPLRV